ncbi:MAG: threonine ammonia-lyase, biosynthetic, partial [Woeseia sp.]
MSSPDYASMIEAADLYDVVRKTPLETALLLSARLDNTILLKREDLQPIFSFKLRGALNKLNRLSKEQLANGVICSSAGNHAQGVALAASRKNVQAVIVMPVTTPSIKVAAVRRLGGETILHGDNYDAAYERACAIARERNLTFIHPFDDPDVIAGQGTIARELIEQWPAPPTAVFVPIGGGGLIGGIASYLKARAAGVRVIGVEAADSASMAAALQAGHPVTLDHVGIFADGVAVRRVGDESFRLCRELVDEVMTVDTDQTCAAVQDIFEDTRSIVEPAGALAVAGIKKYLQLHPTSGETFVAIACGANVNFDRLRHIA